MHKKTLKFSFEGFSIIILKGAGGIRTRDGGFAIRCLRPLGHGAISPFRTGVLSTKYDDFVNNVISFACFN
jgi:hypothetical protein